MKRFLHYSLDTENQYLKRGDETIELAPKSFAVLRYLVDNAGRLVTKEELLEAVWPETHIQEAVLKTCILEVRKALADDAVNPKYIQTRHRRGYQFIAPVLERTCDEGASVRPSALFGRDLELRFLQELLQGALLGSRQIGFVAGEPGIGKTALIDEFLRSDVVRRTARVARGHCLEHFGDREPYYPVLDALSRAGRAWAESALVEILRRHAPTWLMQMPALIPAGQSQALREICFGATRERMLREMTEALEMLAEGRPLILVLEDLHWSDVATIDLVTWIANRPMQVPLLLLATYRPVELILTENPLKSLKQELSVRHLCKEIQLDVLDRSSTGQLIANRFPNSTLPHDLTDSLYRATDGHPLFLVNAIDYCLSHRTIVEEAGTWIVRTEGGTLDVAVPENVIEMIGRQIARLTPQEQSILEAASVYGIEFPVAWVQEVLESEDSGNVDETCEFLCQRQLFLHSARTTTSAQTRYEFIHSLYREAFYRRVAPARRRQLHARFGTCIEKAHRGQERDVSPELAHHFQRSSNHQRAVQYLRLASQRAAKRHAPKEAFALIEQCFPLIERLPEDQRASTEITLLEELGSLHRLAGQLPQAAESFQRMVESAARADDLRAQIVGQQWLAGVLSWFDRERCLEWVDRTKALSVHSIDETTKAIMKAHIAYWNLLFRAWSADDAEASGEGVEACRKSGNRPSFALLGARHCFFLALCARYRDADHIAEESLKVAIELDSLLDYSIAHFFQAWALLHLGDWGKMQIVLREALHLANSHGHPIWALLFRLLETWLHVQALSYTSAARMARECLEESRILKHELSEQMSLVLLGLACVGLGDYDAGERHLTEIHALQWERRILMDWIWKLPLHQGLCELHIARRDWASAEREVPIFQKLSAATAEATWQANAYIAAATISVETEHWTTAQEMIRMGSAAISGFDAPLAEWRLHWLAFRTSHATESALKAQDGIYRLANSLERDSSLRESFLAAEPVATILREHGLSRVANV